MAFDAAQDVARASPWWYRWRLLTIGAAYFCGFFFGNLATSLLGWPQAPAAELWGAGLGPGGPLALYAAAVALAIAAWALRAWGGAYLRPDVVWKPEAVDDRLLVDGPFRYVRNPLYLGNVLLALGIGLLAPPLGFAIVTIGNLAVVLGLMRVETSLLRARYGATFDAYARAVPALVPRLRPAHVEGSVRGTPSLALGLRSEIFSALIALSLLTLFVRALAER